MRKKCETVQEFFIRPIKTIAGSLRFGVKIMIKGKMKAKPPKEHWGAFEISLICFISGRGGG